MKYLIIEPATHSIAYNIALMKYARWCENHGYEYQYVRGMLKPNIVPDVMIMSCIFSFHSEIYKKTIKYYRKLFPNARLLVGGVFPSLQPEWFYKNFENQFFGSNNIEIHTGMDNELEPLIPKYNVDVKDEDYKHGGKKKLNQYYNRKKRIVLYASRGCVNRCGYCAVPRLEGDMKSFKTIKENLKVGMEELPDAEGIVLYDNNFTEHAYIENIINELAETGLPVDIHGLHVDSFDENMAKLFQKLKWGGQGSSSTPYLRFSFDKILYENHVRRAYNIWIDHNIKAGFFCYMLYNYTDSPEQTWARIVKAQHMVEERENKYGDSKQIYLFTQRFNPLTGEKSLHRDIYVGPKWTHEQAVGLKRLSTFIHGFIPVSKSRNIFRWIGTNEKEFKERLQWIGESTKNKPYKFNYDKIGDLDYDSKFK